VKKALDWLDDRSGYRAALDHALNEKVLGGASFAYVFGSVLAFLLGLQFVTGLLLAFYYSPSATDAWASVAYIQDTVTAGWFIRGLHSYGASAIVIIAGIHMLQTAVFGAYKKPRELNWIVGVLLLALLLAFALTGYLLPWDQTGYWATKVATGIAGTTPLAGQELQAAVQGGNEYGNLTITRFFAIHVFILPGALIALTVIHIALFRRHGVTTPWWKSKKELEEGVQPFWPDQLFKDVVAMALVFGLLVLVNVTQGGAHLGAPADPSSNFDARPEWYFRFLFQALKYFHGIWEQIVALGMPVVVGGILLVVPFVDRSDSRNPRQRVKALLPLAALGFFVTLLTWISFREDAADAELQARLVAGEERALLARANAKTHGVPPGGALGVFDVGKTSSDRGRDRFEALCTSCHTGDARTAPDISVGYNSRERIRGFLLAPDSDKYFGLTGISGMGEVALTGRDLDAAVEAVYAETGASDVDRALAAFGRERIEKGEPEKEDSPWNCHGCHAGFDYAAVADNGPGLARRGQRDTLSEFIGRPDHPRWFPEDNEMPAYYDELSRAERLEIADYLLSLRSSPAPGP